MTTKNRIMLIFALIMMTLYHSVSNTPYHPLRNVEVMLKLNIKDNQYGGGKIASVRFKIPKVEENDGVSGSRHRRSKEEKGEPRKDEDGEQKSLKYDKEDISEDGSPLSEIQLPYRSGVPHPTEHRQPDTEKRLYNRHRLRYQRQEFTNKTGGGNFK